MSVACGRIHQGHERFSDDPHSQYSLPIEVLNVIVEFSEKVFVEIHVLEVSLVS